MDHIVGTLWGVRSRTFLTNSLQDCVSCLVLGLLFSNLWLPGREVHCPFHVGYLHSSFLLILLILLLSFVFSNKSLGFHMALHIVGVPAPLHSLLCPPSHRLPQLHFPPTNILLSTFLPVFSYPLSHEICLPSPWLLSSFLASTGIPGKTHKSKDLRL